RRVTGTARQCPGHVRRFRAELRLVILTTDASQVYRRLGQLHVELLECPADDLRNGEIAEPFVVRGDHKPGSVDRAGSLQHLLEGFDVAIPVLALPVVSFADLPSAATTEPPPVGSRPMCWSCNADVV